MKINFKISQKILHKNGYEEKEFSNGKDFKKKLGRKEYPRIHVELEKDKTYSIHIDKKRRHGIINKWLFGSKSTNIINDNLMIREEVMILKLDVYEEVLEEMKNKIIELRNNLKL